MRKESNVDVGVPSGGKVFRGGHFIELARDVNGILKFLTAGGRIGSVVDKFIDRGVTYVVPRLHRSFSDSLVLPTSLGEFESTPKLFNETAELFEQLGSTAIPLAFFVFATWLPEVTPVAPFLWVVMPPGFIAGALKQTLRSACRHSLVLSTISGSFPASIPMELQPTLILEIDKPTGRLSEALRASQTHGSYPTRGGSAVDPFCAKVIFSRYPAVDLAAAGFPLQIFLTSGAGYVNRVESTLLSRAAGEFQNKFLAYRVKNFTKVAPPSFDIGQFTAPVQASACSLASAVVGDNGVQGRIIPYLRELEADLQVDGVSVLNRLIAEVLASRSEQKEIAVTDIAGDVNTLLAGRGMIGEVSPETIGWRLRAFGIHTTTISRGLKGLNMRDAQFSISKIAAIYGVKTADDAPAAKRC